MAPPTRHAPASSSPRAPAPAARRWFPPREHGAYAQLALPLVGALALRGPNLASAALALGAVAAFFAHEPLLVALGHRGGRRSPDRALRTRARAHAAALGTTALAAGLAGLALASPAARATALAPLGLVAVVAALVARRAERSVLGEVLVAHALASAALPVAAAAGAPLAYAASQALAWGLAFSVATLAVHALLRTQRSAKAPASLRALPVLAGALATAALAGLSRAALAPLGAALVVALHTLVAAALALAPPPPRALRRVGWSLVAAGLCSLAAALALAT